MFTIIVVLNQNYIDMKKLFAIPTEGGKLCQHFGHCEKFAIIESENGKVINEDMITPPVHEPGLYPRFLAEKGIKVIIAGGMGQKAQDLFANNSIEVHYGVDADTPKNLVEKYLSETLETGSNRCDH
jgi:predicted Fe-Mo cluster-binding NifX family protein